MPRSFINSFVLLVLFSLILMPSSAFAGKEAFVEKKCVKCHSIKSLDVASTKKDASKVVDVSEFGKHADEAYCKDYLMKKVVDKDDGKKHKMKFKGSDEELAEMCKFLLSLK